MAIEQIRLFNFKCFEDSGQIPLAPLTVIFGRNNTGKSSVLQSILLLRQTLDSPEYGPRLDLRGPLYQAGSYADIVHQHKASQKIRMDFRISLPGGAPAKIELEFSADEPQPARLVRLKVNGGAADVLEVRRGRGYGGPYELVIDHKPQGSEAEALFRFPQSGFFPIIGPEPLRPGRPSKKHEDARGFARDTLRNFEVTLRATRAVGAFRQQPNRRYEYQGRVSESIDAVGRSVVDALIEDSLRRGKKRAELVRSVNKWLKVVGRVRILPFRRLSRTARIFEVRLRDTDSGRWANFADVGFGIGQAFPVFVEGLRTPEGGTFLVQEPEIHLHPDAQLGMADFLVSLAKSGRRVIAETHSENLLLRIRRLVTGKAPALSHKDVSILCVTKHRDGASRVLPLEIDEMAQIKDWPKGFMEEATDERMAILEEMAGLEEVAAERDELAG
ncbi:MAG: AAA family ATPase [Thermoguttaceae bacterium]|jgi:predicted ATPase